MSTGDPTDLKPDASRSRPDGGMTGLPHIVALIAVVVGAAGSLAMMFHVGRRNPSVILMGLFTIWVLSPFVALVLADVFSKRWPFLRPATLRSLMLILAVASLCIYGGVVLRPPAKPAAPFLLVPLGSWVLLVIAAFVSRGQLRRGAGV